MYNAIFLVDLVTFGRRVVLVAADTASALLQSADGQEAFAAKECPQDVRALLRPFLETRRRSGVTPAATVAAATAATAANDGGGGFLSADAFRSRALWAPALGQPYGAWVCTLTARLLSDCYEPPGGAAASPTPVPGRAGASAAAAFAAASRVSQMVKRGLVGRDDFYRLCRPMAALRPAFAELLFPAVIDDLTR